MSEDPTPSPPSPAGQGGRDAGSVSLPPHPHATAVGMGVAVVLVVLDQATKEAAEALLRPGVFVPWLGEHVGWQLVYNPGGAFGLPLPHWVFLLVTVGVLVLVGRILPRSHSLLAATAYGMLLAGAVGNVLDRLLRPGGEAFGSGYVVDFVAWGSFPRFNVADSAITVGFALLVLALWREERVVARAAEAAEAEDVDAAGAHDADAADGEDADPRHTTGDEAPAEDQQRGEEPPP